MSRDDAARPIAPVDAGAGVGAGAVPEGATGAPAPAPAAAPALTLRTVEETLTVDTVKVDRGGWRLTKRVDRHEAQADEVVHEERVEIERRRCDTVVDPVAVPGVRQEGDTTIVPVLEERLVVVKQLVLVEELRITRVRRTRSTPQRHTLRQEHIDIERLEAADPPALGP